MSSTSFVSQVQKYTPFSSCWGSPFPFKTEGITEGFAGLWWRVDGEGGKVLAFDNMQSRGVKDTTSWTRYAISLDIPSNATHINFGVLHPGNGTAWFDSLEVQVDGKPYSDPAAFDLDFESSPPHGFYTGGQGYEVTTDSSVAHSGKQSLRSLKLAQDSHSESDLKVSEHALALKSRDVFEHLANNRAEYVRAGVSAEDADWTIQNAKLVMQFALMQSGEQSRDKSMAENVE